MYLQLQDQTAHSKASLTKTGNLQKTLELAKDVRPVRAAGSVLLERVWLAAAPPSSCWFCISWVVKHLQSILRLLTPALQDGAFRTHKYCPALCDLPSFYVNPEKDFSKEEDASWSFPSPIDWKLSAAGY